MTSDGPGGRPLLLLLAPADHPHRDAVCATLAWLAEAEGRLFECYWDSRRTGGHYGGGPSQEPDGSDLRGGTLTGGRHLEQLLLVLARFRCEAVCLGETVFDGILAEARVPVRARSADVVAVYGEVFATSAVARPAELLVVGRGECSDAALAPYAFPEVVHRRLLAIGDGDDGALSALLAHAPGMRVESLWVPAARAAAGAVPLEVPASRAVADHTVWMAERWASRVEGYLLGDPELVSRWVPWAVRRRWAAVHGVPQAAVIRRLGSRLQRQNVVFGRQQDDRDFLELSRLGTAFQLVDPGRPPFPVVAEAPAPWPPRRPVEAPSDAELRSWAHEGRVLTSLLFWTGMVRELENLYALTEILSLTGMRAGLVLTTESYRSMSGPPLTLVDVARERGGLAPRVELLLASAGAGALLESEAPVERFAATLRESVGELAERLGGRAEVPVGWWGTMDAAMEWHGTTPVGVSRRPPFVRVRYRGGAALPAAARGASATREGVAGDGVAGAGDGVARAGDGVARAADGAAAALRRMVRETPLRHLVERLRPFDGYAPGRPGRAILEAVRDAGFEYAFTKSAFTGPPRVVAGVEDLTVMTYTAGRWDGWTPFVTVNDLSDLRRAERRLLARRAPGWLVSTVDACLWAFSGPVWERGAELHAICRWVAGGGSSGRLVNVTPRTLARYAGILREAGLVETLPAG